MAKKKIKTTTQKEPVYIKKQKKKHNYDFVFNRQKYTIMLIGLGFILVGFLLMIGGGSSDPNEFSESLFSHRRITLAPILVILGYAIEIYAIMKQDKPKEEAATQE